MPALDEALGLLRERLGIDMSSYRRATLQRRLHNRMMSLRARSSEEYLARLRADPDEPRALLGRLTIKVSRFFRDRRAFELLGSGALHTLGRPVRAWSAGCGHGEEAWSLAMVLAASQLPHEVLLATDVDGDALEEARRARYAAAAVRDVPAALAHRYLEPAGPRSAGGVQIAEGLRGRVRFERHDLLGAQWPRGPFDLVCCRNVLIYLEPRAQLPVLQRLIERLAPGGYLWLGEAEWPPPPFAARLQVIDRKGRLFREGTQGEAGPQHGPAAGGELAGRP